MHTPELGKTYERATIAFKGGGTVAKSPAATQDVCSGLSNEVIPEKFRRFTTGIMDDERRDAIERLVLDIEKVEDNTVPEELLAGPTRNSIC